MDLPAHSLSCGFQSDWLARGDLFAALGWSVNYCAGTDPAMAALREPSVLAWCAIVSVSRLSTAIAICHESSSYHDVPAFCSLCLFHGAGCKASKMGTASISAFLVVDIYASLHDRIFCRARTRSTSSAVD